MSSTQERLYIEQIKHLDKAAQHVRDAAESFERSDTDGSLSQWSSVLHGTLEHLRAEIAANGGTAVFPALFLLDGTVASTHQASGQYGPFWVLNDAAEEELGRRFLNTSSAQSAKTRAANNRKKGVTVGTIRVAAYADLWAPESATGLAGALQVSARVFPNVEALKAGDFTVVTTEVIEVDDAA
ncbi:hypothetical protein [Leucobacter sp. cx-169]|uniref:hypothetical protein n=1 Tax=Leucobacter sp. cx-169 TaxID=2770549 RepID=UPI00165E079F|nr:hypothetical protein [Leucobacter sp. cx-169]MBC9927256.1 hypothetical protein [Leucobacter sp. cx-169]